MNVKSENEKICRQAEITNGNDSLIVAVISVDKTGKRMTARFTEKIDPADVLTVCQMACAQLMKQHKLIPRIV